MPRDVVSGWSSHCLINPALGEVFHEGSDRVYSEVSHVCITDGGPRPERLGSEKRSRVIQNSYAENVFSKICKCVDEISRIQKMSLD